MSTAAKRLGLAGQRRVGTHWLPVSFQVVKSLPVTCCSLFCVVDVLCAVEFACQVSSLVKGCNMQHTCAGQCHLCGPLSHVQEEHQGALQGQQLAVMRALLEQQVLPETAAVLATADKNAREIPSSGKERVVPKILVPLVKVSKADSVKL